MNWENDWTQNLYLHQLLIDCNALGKDGWQVASVCKDGSTWHAWLKREIPAKVEAKVPTTAELREALPRLHEEEPTLFADEPHDSDDPPE